MIVNNLKDVEQKIVYACKNAGRSREEVTLVAVSKTKPIEDIQEVLKNNIYEFGENKVQEITYKYDALSKDINWHMIGHLQRNKVKYIIGKVKLIHSVDSIRLAEQIEKESARNNCVTNVLIEINVANEQSKFGFLLEEAEDAIMQIAKMKHINLQGLMTIAPYVENPEDNRHFFHNLHNFFVDISNKNIDNVCMSVLSMGMTGDYQVAIEEGATMVRVGTGIFGERNYKQIRRL